MKKIINFEKQVEFPTMIGEITSISLEKDLEFKDSNSIEGKLLLEGTYKRTEASRLEEDFSFDIPTEIILTEQLDLQTAQVEIDDFYYEIENEDTLKCHIDLLVEGVELIDLEEPVLEPINREISEIEVRECDGDIQEEKVKEDDIQEEKIEITDEDDVGSLFTSLKDCEETFSTYSVYIFREEDTLEKIIEKYKTTKEKLEYYNDLSNINIGSKIIIPLDNETD